MNHESSLDSMLESAVNIAREAGLLTLRSFRSVGSVTSKRSDVDLVTQTDVDSEALISQRLSEQYPEHGLLFEEGTEKAASGRQALWIVDPLDGTINFAHGHPFYCISIALQLDGELSLGVVHAPALDLTWTARRGDGARRNGELTRVTKRDSLAESLCSSGFPYDRRTASDNNVSEWSHMVRRARAVRRCGAAAIDLAMVADGTYDGYWEKRLNPWDIAAGTLLVEEAGGRVSDVNGNPLPPWPEVIVATNGLVHDEILRVLSSAGSEWPEPR